MSEDRIKLSNDKIKLSKADRRSVMLRSQFLQGSWNYERMQNGGWAYSLIPALKKLYPNKDDAAAALKRHLEFFNTHPYIAAPILGVTLVFWIFLASGVISFIKSIGRRSKESQIMYSQINYNTSQPAPEVQTTVVEPVTTTEVAPKATGAKKSAKTTKAKKKSSSKK